MLSEHLPARPPVTGIKIPERRPAILDLPPRNVDEAEVVLDLCGQGDLVTYKGSIMDTYPAAGLRICALERQLYSDIREHREDPDRLLSQRILTNAKEFLTLLDPKHALAYKPPSTEKNASGIVGRLEQTSNNIWRKVLSSVGLM